MKTGAHLDCHKCRYSHKMYDHTGKWTVKIFCSQRNGKLKKRFRGECKYVEQGSKE